MKQTYILVFAFIVLAIPYFTIAQVSVPSNAGLNINYVGWDAAQTFPVQIKHEGNQPINIFTNNTTRAQFSTGAGLGVFYQPTTNGDGLRIFDPTPGFGNLSLWTSAQNQSHANMRNAATANSPFLRMI